MVEKYWNSGIKTYLTTHFLRPRKPDPCFDGSTVKMVLALRLWSRQDADSLVIDTAAALHSVGAHNSSAPMSQLTVVMVPCCAFISDVDDFSNFPPKSDEEPLETVSLRVFLKHEHKSSA